MSRGVGYMILAIVLLAVQQVLVKLLPAIPVEEIVFFRAFISLLICIGIMPKKRQSFKGENYTLLFLRGLIGTLSLLTFFYSIHTIPLATAVTIGQLSPIFLGILAFLFLKEKIHNSHWIALLISFAGVVLVKGFDMRVSSLELGVAISSALLAAMAHFTVRLLKNENTLTVLFYFSTVMIITLLPFVILNWKSPTNEEWIILLMVGVVSHYAQFFLTKALKMEEISKINGIYYLGIVIAVLIGLIFFDENFNIETLIGLTIILSGVIFGYFYKSDNNAIADKKRGI